MRPHREAKTPRRPRVLTCRLVVVSLVVGVVLAVVSVIAGAVHAQRVGTAGVGSAVVTRFENRTNGDRSARLHWPGSTWWAAMSSKRLAAVTEFGRPSAVDAISVHPDELPLRVRTMMELGSEEVQEINAGWPLRAAYTVKTVPGTGAGPIYEGRGIVRVGGRDWTIPTLPLWPGLLGNTLFYTLLVLTPLVLLRWRKLSRRGRRGLCLACGYELGDGVGACPECGLVAGGS